METIDDIMDNFDFDEVHKAMTLLGWRWYVPKNRSFEIPTINEIKRRARSLLEDAYNSDKDLYSTATGGFEATKTVEDDSINLSLSFVVASWDEYA